LLPPRFVVHGDAAVSCGPRPAACNSRIAARTPGHPAIFALVIGYDERGHDATRRYLVNLLGELVRQVGTRALVRHGGQVDQQPGVSPPPV